MLEVRRGLSIIHQSTDRWRNPISSMAMKGCYSADKHVLQLIFSVFFLSFSTWESNSSYFMCFLLSFGIKRRSAAKGALKWSPSRPC